MVRIISARPIAISVRPIARKADEIVSNAAPTKINEIPIMNSTPLIRARKHSPCIDAPAIIVITPSPMSNGPTKDTGKPITKRVIPNSVSKTPREIINVLTITSILSFLFRFVR